jgi:hypothetical protein
MKTIVTSLILMSASSLLAQQPQAVTNPQVSPQALYERGVMAMNRGDVANAEKDLRAALRANPQHPHAKYVLNQLMTNRDKIAARYRENMMKSTTVAKVEYSDASVSECLESLNKLVEEATKQKFTPNFILKDPTGKLKSKTVTLTLANIPASQVLQYIGSSANCKITYEEHAIVVEAK